ncbi:MAG: hypothetical protein US74_C0035G0012 [Parcubacteria group bacterium GW2011_GWA2_38_13]|nr:MAG: hypothetical protein US74_C0035G0012 [Parcubacteria group bacterium GW2011_GWA2_38_13]
MITKDLTFSLMVDYDRPYEDGIAACNFRGVNLDFSDDLWYGEVRFLENHYLTGRGKKEVFFRYFYFGRWISSMKVIAEMENEGYRPAVLKELLAVVEQRQEFRESSKAELLALGTDWPVGRCPHCADSCHHHNVASLNVGRGMGVLVGREQNWDPEGYFLAVRKEE